MRDLRLAFDSSARRVGWLGLPIGMIWFFGMLLALRIGRHRMPELQAWAAGLTPVAREALYWVAFPVTLILTGLALRLATVGFMEIVKTWRDLHR
jgi:hypothetical protein